LTGTRVENFKATKTLLGAHPNYREKNSKIVSSEKKGFLERVSSEGLGGKSGRQT